jgi:hypothetical protein
MSIRFCRAKEALLG